MSHDVCGKQLLKGLLKYRVDPKLEARAIGALLQSLDCPRSLAVWLMYQNNEHDQLANLEFDPLNYNSFADVRDAYAATKLLSKFSGLNLGADLEEVALQKFKKYEDLCKQSNVRFANLAAHQFYTGEHVQLHHAVVRKIEAILGEFDAEEFASSSDWGPGASTLIKRADASSSRKFQYETGITRDLYSLIPPDLMGKIYPLWARHLVFGTKYPEFQVGSKVITVPKDATTDRVIAIEPGINLWFQKSIGEMINRRLLRFGIDLHDQGRNQRLARLGSETSLVATVDLSSASDSIAASVVRELLPPRWYSVMDSCRTKYGILKRDGLEEEVIRWAKFSSMGNGFTFSLESLIFYAVAICCTEALHEDQNLVSVYGDDVIIPTSVFSLLSEVLSFYGFVVNTKKSHYDSPFRESCGAHYFNGFDVKPVYLKGRVSSVQAVYRLANAIRRYAHRCCSGWACDKRFRLPFALLVSSVPRALRLRIAEGLGDGGFIGNFDEATPSRERHGIEGYRVYHLMDQSKTLHDDQEGYFLSSLWDLSKRDEALRPVSSRPLTLKAMYAWDDGEVKKKGYNSTPLHESVPRVVHSVVRQWSDLGPWI
jgi:hypothetical protein